MSRVLIVEDDADIIDLISIHLDDLNVEVTKAMDGQTGFDLAQSQHFDLIILDLMIPKMDGLQVCQKLRALDNFTPILMLTAKSEEFDKVLGLESGADDYMTKPFGIREFIARVKAILRRNESWNENRDTKAKTLEYGDIHIDTERRKVQLGESRIELTPKEFQLLQLLAENPGRSFSREELLSTIWGYEFQGYEHTVNSHVNRLRAKIEPNDKAPKYILTTWGVGYRFNEEIA
ncbi:response regulator transcription factor [Phaeocystidibacter luteus]|uniref:Phosphate regulon transcriptional regulatory protein PhoB n=1 Tax=Phaeocystidibacter luteus TaxID=911197 RepID=A0A6N6RKD1_9FLAO|nr:response regulator transcription factor [Phaeocystidibacter luteus]KAB2805352.1 response regulator transcription factor [Phaeocystidibacter luteus]